MRGGGHLEKIKNITVTGGLNIIVAITKDGDFYRSNTKTNKFYADEGEIKNLYTNWGVLEFESKNRQAFQKRADGNPMNNVTDEIIVRKPNE